jgi:hypothetical protein
VRWAQAQPSSGGEGHSEGANGRGDEMADELTT